MRVKIDSETGCWLWTGALINTGYGQLGLRGNHHLAHRLVYEVFVGPIPPKMDIDHLCRTRNCVNPGHLEVVTHSENVFRGNSPPAINAARTHCKHGHEFTEENTYIRLRGGRLCRRCNADRQRARKLRLKEAV